MTQVMQNLIGNAIQHGETGAPVVVRISDSGSEAFLEVVNRGPPIPRHLLPHLFEPFRRGSHGAGLGLGLYIAHAIVIAHGGTIDVESHETTAFRVRLPLITPASDSVAASA
jgi:signal transduction histidine kinase